MREKDLYETTELLDTPLDGTVIDIETEQFVGTATLEFERILRGKHRAHEYYVKFDGEFKHNQKPQKTRDRLVVAHNNGDPYQYKSSYASGKDLKKVLAKSAPSWVPVSSLAPR